MQQAVLIADVPNAIFESVSSLLGFLNVERTFQINKALDAPRDVSNRGGIAAPSGRRGLHDERPPIGAGPAGDKQTRSALDPLRAS